MFFRSQLTVTNLALGEGEFIRFDYDVPHQVTVFFRRPNSMEQAKGHKSGNAFCIALSTATPSAKAIMQFHDYMNALKDYHSKREDEWELPPEEISAFPKDSSTQEFTKAIYRELFDFGMRTAKTLLWRCNLYESDFRIAVGLNSWSFDTEEWYSLSPDLRVISFGGYTYPRGSREIKEQVHDTVLGGFSEPLGHEIYRRAWQQRSQDWDATIVTAMMAAEVGFKQIVSNLVPEAKWLVDNVSTPPLARMLEEFLPTLPAKNKINGKVVSPPKLILKEIKDGVSIRNTIVHSGKGKKDYDKAERILAAVKDLLWLFDYYSGHTWALENMREETLNALRL